MGINETRQRESLAEYHELVLEGRGPDISDFCARYPEECDLRRRIEALDALRVDLGALASSSGGSAREAPETIGGFKILRSLGRGGMARVYLA